MCEHNMIGLTVLGRLWIVCSILIQRINLPMVCWSPLLRGMNETAIQEQDAFFKISIVQ
ncbi:hypothetical protein B398_08285 [Xylella fastidiosa 32]|uniref:Uncharacterized protein n=1 Tax=Xylella fastidiosa (strain 9a5c) TaxID=160492 RepID=Q9PDR4_XYLFA|nr:hypothetical protein XF_1315 [Xylella fastidiosa 9a5c]ETE31350.1 hypothetical protein B398_08285 [Xylella fastidiosa 32]